MIPVAVAMRGRDGGATCEISGEVANALRSADGGGSKPFVLAETATALRSRDQSKGVDSDCTDTPIPTVAEPIRETEGWFGPPGGEPDNLICTAQNTGQGYWKESEVGETLRCCGKGGESRNANLAVFSVAENQRAEVVTSEVIPSLSTPGGKPGMGYPCIAINARQDPITTKEISGPLDVFGNSHGITTGLRVRRLLPVECELLQGMPPGHTARTPDKELADGPRYKLIGNSMAVPVMRWIGRRIQAVATRKETP